jgi:hypothetical protein
MRIRSAGILLLGSMALPLAASCGRDEPRLADTMPDTLPPLGQVATDPAAPPVDVDVEVLRREADELDRHVLQLRAHIQTMRQLSPLMAGTVMAEHAAHVSAVRERNESLRATLSASDTRLQELLGMTADEYRVLIEEVETASSEVAEMQRGDEENVRARLPGHLDRLERIAGQMEQAAAHLRR